MAIGLYKADSLDESRDEPNASEAHWSREFEGLVRRELELVGEDPKREGLLQTPEWSWCGDRGLSPVHDDARGAEAELEDDNVGVAWGIPGRSQDPRRVPATGALDRSAPVLIRK